MTDILNEVDSGGVLYMSGGSAAERWGPTEAVCPGPPV